MRRSKLIIVLACLSVFGSGANAANTFLVRTKVGVTRVVPDEEKEIGLRAVEIMSPDRVAYGDFVNTAFVDSKPVFSATGQNLMHFNRKAENKDRNNGRIAVGVKFISQKPDNLERIKVDIANCPIVKSEYEYIIQPEGDGDYAMEVTVMPLPPIKIQKQPIKSVNTFVFAYNQDTAVLRCQGWE